MEQIRQHDPEATVTPLTTVQNESPTFARRSGVDQSIQMGGHISESGIQSPGYLEHPGAFTQDSPSH